MNENYQVAVVHEGQDRFSMFVFLEVTKTGEVIIPDFSLQGLEQVRKL